MFLTTTTTKIIEICCIDQYGELLMMLMFYTALFCKGIEHFLLYTVCDCEPSITTLVRGNIWPATIQRPKLGFSFDLLDWAESLMLECQVAVKYFCKALYFRYLQLMFKVIQLLMFNCVLI